MIFSSWLNSFTNSAAAAACCCTGVVVVVFRFLLLLLLLLACGCFFAFRSALFYIRQSLSRLVRRDARFRVLSQLHLLFFSSAPHTCAGSVRKKRVEDVARRKEEKQIRFSASVFSSFQTSSYSTIYFSYCTQFLLACTVATNNWFELSLIRVKWLKKVFSSPSVDFCSLSLAFDSKLLQTHTIVVFSSVQVTLMCF